MRRNARLVLAAAGTAAAVAALDLAGALLVADGCENGVIAEVPSPRGTHRAVVFARSCGATTGFSTQVSVLPKGVPLRDGGNAFVADSDHGRAPEGPGRGPAVRVTWRGDADLVVRHHPRARLFRSERVVGGVRIVYEAR